MCRTLEKLFPLPEKIEKTGRPVVNDYDIKFTLNKNGVDNKGATTYAVRIALLNDAVKIYNDYQNVEMSDVLADDDRIYFRAHEQKWNRNIHKLSTSTVHTTSRYFQIKATGQREKRLRANFIGKKFKIEWDEELCCYYIDKNHALGEVE